MIEVERAEREAGVWGGRRGAEEGLRTDWEEPWRRLGLRASMEVRGGTVVEDGGCGERLGRTTIS